MFLVLVGLTLLGATSGVLGAFALLRRKALLSDTFAHATLPGVCLAYLLGGKQMGWLLAGAFISSLLSVGWVSVITHRTRLKEDAALALTLSVFFGFGMVLLTGIQRWGDGYQSGLDRFLFGQAAALLPHEVGYLATACLLILLVVGALFKEFTLMCFDRDYALAIGLPVRWLDALLMGLIALMVVLGLQSAGALLMVALMITPAAAARLCTHRLSLMIWLAALFGMLSAAGGVLMSALYGRLPTGPVMVLIASALFAVAFLFRYTVRGERRWQRP
ncbi:Manganese transport system membrane protein MntB [bacterium HR15]|nr:Manganese transport system membrane protein MntB [bacterium HR15]